jgi:hypothetical protein
MATHLLRYMPPRGQEVKTHRSVLKFKLSPPNSKYQSTPVSVDRSKTPAQEAAEWIANPKEWPDYVPSYEVWCAMTCSSGNYKDDLTPNSVYLTLQQLLLTESPAGQVTNGKNGTLERYLEDGKPQSAYQQPNTAKQVAESAKTGTQMATRRVKEKILPKYEFTGFWPEGPKVLPEGLIGLDMQIKMRKEIPNKDGFFRVPHTYNIENQLPSSQQPLYHLEAVSSIMPYTKRQWTLNMGIEIMGTPNANTDQMFQKTHTGFGKRPPQLGTSLSNIEFLRGPTMLGQIALLYGLYEYPDCDNPDLNWSVTQTEPSTGATHTVRMRVPNPAYWLIDDKEFSHYRCIEPADEHNLAFSKDNLSGTKAFLARFVAYPWMKQLKEITGMSTLLPKFDNPIHWWGYNSLGSSYSTAAFTSLMFFPGMRVPSVDTFLKVPLLPETQIFHRFKAEPEDSRSMLSPFFFVGVRDDQATRNNFVKTSSPWGLYGYIAYRMRRNAELMSACSCVAPFPTTQPQMLTGFRIPRARWMYPHFNLADDTFAVKAGNTPNTPTYVAEAAVGRNLHTFLKLLTPKLKTLALSTYNDFIARLISETPAVHDGFVYMEHLQEFFTNFISLPHGDADRTKWMLGEANLRKLRVRALHVKPLEVRNGDTTHADITSYSATPDVLAPVPGVPGVSITDAEEETDVTSLETRHEMDQLNAADENRGSILEADNEAYEIEQYQPAQIDDALSKLVDEKIDKGLKQDEKVVKPDGMFAPWEKPKGKPHSNRHFAKASDAPWCYNNVYEQASSKPEYDTSPADTDEYVALYGSSYNLYLDGPNPRLLKGFAASYGMVKIFAPNSKPVDAAEEVITSGRPAGSGLQQEELRELGGGRGIGQQRRRGTRSGSN